MKLAALRGNWRPQGGSGHTARAAAAALVVSLLLSLACCEDAASGAPAPAPASGLPWALLFSDEFDSPGGLDYGKWTPMIGQGYEYGLPGFANGELQYYTSKPENLRLENGMIVIQAQQSDPGNPYSATSARISTLDKFSVSPSAEYPTIRLEARMKVPQGAALWAAFWALPQVGSWYNSSCIGCGRYGHWAASGEIDVAEAANDMRQVQGTVHFGAQAPGNAKASGGLSLEWGSLADDFHVFAVEWELTEMRWYLDDAHYFTAYSAGTGREGGWYSVGEGAGPDAPFDSPFYLILNLAVGGPTTAFTGYVPLGDTLASPKQLLVDYVRVHGLPFALSQRTRRRRGA